MENNQKVKVINAFREKNEHSLLGRDGIVGVGTGFKEVNGVITEELCMRIYVEKKIVPGLLTSASLLPKTIQADGAAIPTDVIEIGHVVPLRFFDKMRPAPNGISIGPTNEYYAGTKGLIVIDNVTGRKAILSNNHILAGSNMLPVGTPILQPAFPDGASRNDAIAVLSRFQPIVFNSTTTNTVDAAIAEVTNEAYVTNDNVSPQIKATDPVVGLLFCASPTMSLCNLIENVRTALNIRITNPTAVALLGMKVHKSGRSSGYTTGTVTDINASIKLDFSPGMQAVFTQQIIVGGASFASAGDSGAAIYQQQ